MKTLREFADKYILVFSDIGEVCPLCLETEFADDCRALKFTMDLFAAYQAKGYPEEALQEDSPTSTAALRQILPSLDREDCGELLFSQWRAITHWHYIADFKPYQQFFLLLLSRLKELC